MNLHGSSVAITTLVEALVERGARMARPGEFTERAFLNGRLDLTQAEAVNDTVRAATSRQLAMANELREGSLHREVSVITHGLTSLLAAIEASVDFSEEVGDVDVPKAMQTLGEAAQGLNVLIDRAQRGRIVREGLRIAIVGPPNAGKSSLLNRLLGVERAIVTPIAGTTRDYVEESCVLAGIQCALIDTAGLRESNDEVESIGIQRARAQASRADVVWYVFDSSIGLTESDQSEIEGFDQPVQLVANKSDLGSAPQGIPVSNYTGSGLDSLIATIAERATGLEGAIPNARHQHHFESALEAVQESKQGFEYRHPADLVVTHIRTAIHELGLVTGEAADGDLLSQIFRDFCVGK